MSDTARIADDAHHEDAIDSKVLLDVLARIKEGDFTARMPHDWTGIAGKVADGINDIIIADQALGTELTRVSQVVGKQGELSQRVVLAGLTQRWSGRVESVNNLINDLVRPTVEMQRVIGAVADGDLSKQVSADVHGEMLELKNTINAMVDQLNRFMSEVTRVTREVGTEGKLGQAAAVTIEVGGVWKDLTDNVNLMATNLTGQVRNIAEVTTAVANGDLSKKISIDVKGEFLELKNTVNAMVDQLNAFASEVTRVAREVGVEGKLGGQAQSNEVAGVWKDLTDNVNQLANNLTTQVRAIADVATAVTQGDLTRQVRVEASGEVGALQDSLNEMIRNLRETTRQNVEQDWLKTNLERFTRMLQGQRNLAVTSNLILSELAPLVSAQHAVFYSVTPSPDGGDPILEFQAGYGYKERKHLSSSFRIGEGLVGQCAKEKKRILLTDVPSDYVQINSGLGESTPLNIFVLPVLFEGSLRAVIELASFSPFSITHQTFLDRLTEESIGLVLSTIEGNTLTETLLEQAQSQAEELSSLTRAASVMAFSISESGMGVKVEDQQRIFEAFAQADGITSRGYGGSGLGLSISRELVGLLGGEITLTSTSGQGSTFTVYLPDRHAPAASVAKTTAPGVPSLSDRLSVSALAGTKILIVDDDTRNTFALGALLEQGYADVTFAESGVAALAALERMPDIDIVLMDIMMPVMDGYTAIRAIRKSDRFKALPIVVVTSKMVAGERQRCMDAGANDYVAKPVDSAELLSALRPWLPAARPSTPPIAPPIAPISSSNGAAPNPEPPVRDIAPATAALSDGHYNGLDRQSAAQNRPPSNGAPAYVVERRRILVVDDDYRNSFSLSALLERERAVVTVAESGQEALAALHQNPNIDIVLMDIMMPVMDGYEAIRQIRMIDQFKTLPIIALTGKVIAGERQRCIDAGANDYVSKPVDTADLLSTLKLWLPIAAPSPWPEGVLTAMVDPSPPSVSNGHHVDSNSANGPYVSIISGVKILMVDDDHRNIFALSALLERGHADVRVAESGPEALAALEKEPDIAIVLMDIMMPFMDGYETIKAIRGLGHFKALPIIAVTGKVIPGERQRCMDAGANDYVPKPVDTSELLAALRPWIPKTASSTGAA